MDVFYDIQFLCFITFIALSYFVFFVQAEGYSDGDLTLYHTFSVTEFLKAENPVDFLSKANEVRFQNTSLIFQTSVCMPSNTLATA